MRDPYRRLLEELGEAFAFRKPIYDFGHCSPGEPSPTTDRPRPTPETATPDAMRERLGDLTQLPYPDGAARTVICRGALEYVFEPQRAVDELVRLVEPGGLVILVAAGRGGPVSQPGQFWHVTPAAIERLLAPLSAAVVGWQGPDESPRMVFGVGCKAPVSAAMIRGTARLARHLEPGTEETAVGRGWLGGLWRRVSGVRGSVARPARIRRQERIGLLIHLPLNRASRENVLAGCLPPAPTGTRLDLSR